MYLNFHPLRCGHSLFLPLSATDGGRIKTISYANGHRMEAFDNAYGEWIAEKRYDAADTLIAQYRYAYHGNPNVVRSVDISGLSEYNYMHEDGRLARALNSSWFALPKAWAQAFCNLADKMGRKLFFDVPHGRYGYHIHLGGQNGQRLEELHFQVVKSVWNFLKKLFGR